MSRSYGTFYVENKEDDEKKPLSALFNDPVSERLVNQLLQYVVQGEQFKAEAVVKKNSALMFEKAKVTDYSGRTFPSISAWEYALWAYDQPMWEMLQKHFSGDQKKKALEQMEMLEQNGVSYTFRDFVTKNQTEIQAEPHHNLVLLRVLLKQCMVSQKNIKNLTLQVGAAQRMLPVSVVKMYCHYGRASLASVVCLPRPHRTLYYGKDGTSPFTDWFPLAEGLGTKFALVRGLGSAAPQPVESISSIFAEFDHRRLQYWSVERMSSLTELKESLEASLSCSLM